MIECLTVYGQKKIVTKERLILRVAVYGIIIDENNKVLLISSTHNKKYFFPGGGLTLGTTIKETLQKEIQEETGIDVEVLKLIDIKENYFYYDPVDESFQTVNFFYLCKPLNFDLVKNEDIKDADAENPTWVPIANLTKEMIAPPADEFLEFLKNYKRE